MTITVDWVSGLKLADVKVGDVLICDGGFTCVPAGAVVGIFRSSGDGILSFACSEGDHGLNGQLNADGTLSGLMRAPATVEIVVRLAANTRPVPAIPAGKVSPQTAAARAEAIIDLIADHTCGDRERAAQLDAILVDDLSADSLDGVELEMAIEMEFDLPDDAMADKIKPDWRVRDVIDAVEKALAS